MSSSQHRHANSRPIACPCRANWASWIVPIFTQEDRYARGKTLKHLYLVDGSGFIFRAFHAIRR